MPKKVNDIAELAEGLGFDAKGLAEVRRKVADRSISGMLAALRARKGLTQKEFALRIGRTQSAVSKLEMTENANLRIGDLQAYASFMGMNISIDFFEPRNLAQEIRLDVTRLEKHLNELEKLRQADGTISESIQKFRESITSLLLDIIAVNIPEQPGSQTSDRTPLFSVENAPASGKAAFK